MCPTPRTCEIPEEVVTEVVVNGEYTEPIGTETLDMIRPCVKSGLPEPDFAVTRGFVTTAPRAALAGQPESQPESRPESQPGRGQAGVQVTGQEPISKSGRTTQETTQETDATTQETTQERILTLLRENPRLTRKVLAVRIGITADGVGYHLANLRKAGRIRHVGATKKGRWEVLDDGHE